MKMRAIYELERKNQFSHMIFEASTATIYIVETVVATTRFSKSSYTITTIDADGNVASKVIADSKEYDGKRTATIIRNGQLFMLWRDLSSEDKDALSKEWKAKAKNERGPKYHSNGKRLNLYKLDLASGTSEFIKTDLPPAILIVHVLPFGNI